MVPFLHKGYHVYTKKKFNRLCPYLYSATLLHIGACGTGQSGIPTTAGEQECGKGVIFRTCKWRPTCSKVEWLKRCLHAHDCAYRYHGGRKRRGLPLIRANLSVWQIIITLWGCRSVRPGASTVSVEVKNQGLAQKASNLPNTNCYLQCVCPKKTGNTPICEVLGASDWASPIWLPTTRAIKRV